MQLPAGDRPFHTKSMFPEIKEKREIGDRLSVMSAIAVDWTVPLRMERFCFVEAARTVIGAVGRRTLGWEAIGPRRDRRASALQNRLSFSKG
ncbi:hypothetical protein [Vacuolonema iberomarrocanum]|uniref:hypothetical protein n=1 Tax=Vacuolonema iberomarrocanum TaxID=3454632 RepID=UPI0019E2E6B2|nr:hypothetical protein [filamentous cyanobacterium LEGE 07170]